MTMMISTALMSQKLLSNSLTPLYHRLLRLLSSQFRHEMTLKKERKKMTEPQWKRINHRMLKVLGRMNPELSFLIIRKYSEPFVVLSIIGSKFKFPYRQTKYSEIRNIPSRTAASESAQKPSLTKGDEKAETHEQPAPSIDINPNPVYQNVGKPIMSVSIDEGM